MATPRPVDRSGERDDSSGAPGGGQPTPEQVREEEELHRNEQISDTDETDPVDLGSELSFPASDPPAY
jgi:hypothetical protein